MANDYSIAVLLPTRGRTESLSRSVFSVVEQAQDPDSIELIFAVDTDDAVGLEHFDKVIHPWLEEKDMTYQALQFESLGYAGLNQYYNKLAELATADWLFVWNDDAVMDTQGWDTVIRQYDGQFKVLKVHTHNEHPYSIFPIVPRIWFDTLGVLSRHQMIDAEISQNAYMLDIIEIVPINVTHEQSELTGKQDSTSAQKYRFEGNINDPRDFHYLDVINRRHADCKSLSAVMKSQDLSTEFFEQIFAGQQDPWEKLKLNDVNHHMYQFQTVPQ
jgi:hypothetical protein